jgi:hypothetical protein
MAQGRHKTPKVLGKYAKADHATGRISPPKTARRANKQRRFVGMINSRL